MTGDAFGPRLAVLRDRSRIRVSAFGAIAIALAGCSDSRTWEYRGDKRDKDALDMAQPGLRGALTRVAFADTRYTVSEEAAIAAELRAASAIEAATAGETTQIGSTEGESATAAGGDAQTPQGASDD